MRFLNTLFDACCAPRLRLPLLRSDAAGAPQACLTMLAARFGRPVPAAVEAGASLADMMRALGAAGLACRLRSLAQAGTAALCLPCILSWDGPSYVVLAALGEDEATLHDPVHGLLQVPLAALRARSRGAALECLAPDACPLDGGEPARRQARLPRTALGGLRLLAFALATEGLALLAPALAMPALLWLLVDVMLVGGDYSWLPLLAILAGLALPLHGSLRAAQGLLLRPPLAGAAYVRQLRSWRGARLVPPPNPAPYSPPFAFTVTLGLVACLPIAGLLGFLQPRLLVLALGVAGMHVLLRRRFHGRLAQLRAAEAHVKVQCAQLRAGAREMAELMARFGRAKAERRRRQALAVTALAATLARWRAIEWLRLGQAALAGWLVASVLMIVGAETQSLQLTPGAALAQAWLCGWLAWRCARLLDAVMAGESGPAPLECVAIPIPARPARAHAVPAAVFEARQLGFRYPGAPAPCLQGLDLRIAAGETVLLCGAGGAGKTTLCRLLAGQLAPDTGQLYWPPAAALVAVVAVFADERLQAGSIAQNLSLFTPLPPTAHMEACLRLAGAQAAVGALPGALETMLEDGGAPLPHSLRQRLLVARALYARPAVLLLDEATSALEADEERALLAALAAAGIACLVASRRLEASVRQGELSMRTLRLSA